MQPEQNLISDEAQFSLSQAVDLFSLPVISRVPFLFQHNEVSEEWSTSSALIQNTAVLRTTIIPNCINWSPTLSFVQSGRYGRLVNRGESKEDSSNLQMHEEQKSKKRNIAIIQQVCEPMDIIKASPI